MSLSLLPVLQDPSDSHVLQELMWRVKPDVVIELGTNTGGGALWFASILSLMSPTARVITIDPNGVWANICCTFMGSNVCLWHRCRLYMWCCALLCADLLARLGG